MNEAAFEEFVHSALLNRDLDVLPLAKFQVYLGLSAGLQELDDLTFIQLLIRLLPAQLSDPFGWCVIGWLNQLTDPEFIVYICKEWFRTRQPWLGVLLNAKHWHTGLFGGPIDKLTVYTALQADDWQCFYLTQPVFHLIKLAERQQVLSWVHEASQDSNSLLAERGQQLLNDWLNWLGNQWFATRETGYLQLLFPYRQNFNGPMNLLLQLASGVWQPLIESPAETVPDLVLAAQDRDPLIVLNARLVLQNLAQPAAQQMLCQVIIETAWPVAQQAALAAGFRPEPLPRRAMFYFLTGQWEAYEGLDFDHRLMQAVYHSADVQLRQRLIAKVRESGRVEYLGILGRELSSQLIAGLSDKEVELIVQILAQNQDWGRLWSLALEVTLPHSADIMRILNGANWRPDRLDEQAIFDQLRYLALRTRTFHVEELSWPGWSRLLMDWFLHPLGQMRPWDRLPEIRSDMTSFEIPSVILLALQYIETVLVYGSRFDVELGEAPLPSPYDIEIEDTQF